MVPRAGYRRFFLLMKSDQQETPLIDAILAFRLRSPSYFCIPAHRNGTGMGARNRSLLGENAFLADLTEAEGLDDLHAPAGAIEKAQRLAARLWGSEQCHFLVNGSTAGNEALLLACVREGEEVLVARGAHLSVLSGLVLSGAVPLWYTEKTDIPGGAPADPAAIAAALDAHPGIRAVFLTSPTYYGVCSPLREIARICHEKGKPLLVDAAHGSHLAFLREGPECAVAAGADAVVMSMHKTGGSLTQSSLLHIQGNRIDRSRLRFALRVVMSSSPSYPLMASLDGARHQLATSGRELMHKASFLAEQARKKLGAIRGIRLLEMQQADPLRLVFSAEEAGLSGIRLQELLFSEGNVSLELSDAVWVVAVITWANTEADIDTLTEAVRAVLEKYGHDRSAPGSRVDFRAHTFPAAEPVISPRQAWLAESGSVPLSDAEGRIAAESVIPYPPGIPVICPGERITSDVLTQICELQKNQIPLRGMSDPSMKTLRVTKNEGCPYQTGTMNTSPVSRKKGKA